MTTNTPLTGNFTNLMQNNTDQPLTYTCEQARKLLGKCSKDTFYAGIKSGIIPHIRLSERKIIIPKARFHLWLEGKQPAYFENEIAPAGPDSKGGEVNPNDNQSTTS